VTTIDMPFNDPDGACWLLQWGKGSTETCWILIDGRYGSDSWDWTTKIGNATRLTREQAQDWLDLITEYVVKTWGQANMDNRHYAIVRAPA